MKKGWYWPWLIIALLVATAAGQGVMLYAATHDATFSLEPDYYRKAVAWDTVMQQERANRALGWHASAVVGTSDATGRDVAISLAGGDGRPVHGARVRVTAIHNLDGDHHIARTLVGGADGRYTGHLPLVHDGLWELRVSAMRGRDQFTTSLRVDAPGTPTR
jgi:nitrogen fixation protein FixH